MMDGHIIRHYRFEKYKSMLWSSYDGHLTPSLFSSNLFSQIWPLKGKGEREQAQFKSAVQQRVVHCIFIIY